MLLQRRSFLDVWDSLSKVFSVIFMLQIRPPHLKYAFSNDAMKCVYKLNYEVPPLGLFQSQGDLKCLSELHYNCQIHEFKILQQFVFIIKLHLFSTCGLYYFFQSCGFCVIKSPIGYQSHCSLAHNVIQLLHWY